MYFIGIDVSTKESVLCILDGKGKIVRETKLLGDICAPPARERDHPVGAGGERGRKCYPEARGGLEVDRHVEVRRLLDRQIGRLGALGDAIDVVRLQRHDHRKARAHDRGARRDLHLT
jgi:hypothetical protein